MSTRDRLLDRIDRLVDQDDRYHRQAYLFVLSALEHVVGRLSVRRHISGRELLEGIRQFGLDQFGLMTKTVFNHWGVDQTEDFGEIVFRLVSAGLLSKQERDSMVDFRSVYDFDEAFVRRYPWNREEWDI